MHIRTALDCKLAIRPYERRQAVAESHDRKKSAEGRKPAEDRAAQAKDAPRERRASHRVSDDQKSGQGSMSALSKLRMIERKRAPLRALRDDTV